MTTTTPPSTAADVTGPIDFVLIEFSADRLTGEVAPVILDLVDRGVVRLYDLVVIRKGEDGSVQDVPLTDLGADAGFEQLVGARSGLVDEEDIQEAAEAMRPGTTAALFVYENLWAVPFVAAVRNSGGELIASARIPGSDVVAVLDDLESHV